MENKRYLIPQLIRRVLVFVLIIGCSINVNAQAFYWSYISASTGYLTGAFSGPGAACQAANSDRKAATERAFPGRYEFRENSPTFRSGSYLNQMQNDVADWKPSGDLNCNLEYKGIDGDPYGWATSVYSSTKIVLRGESCPPGTTFGADGEVGCVPNVTPNPDTNNGPPKCPGGNPINIATGNKFQFETDWTSSSNPLFRLERYYNSTEGQWRFSYESSLLRVTEGTPRCAIDPLDLSEPECASTIEYQAELVSAGGREWNYSSLPVNSLAESVGTWTPSLATTSPLIKRPNYSDENIALTDVFERQNGALTEVYAYHSTSGIEVLYSLRYVRSRHGHAIAITHEGNLMVVDDTQGHSLSLVLDGSGLILSANLPDNYSIEYQYNGDGMLSKVLYPDVSKEYIYDTTNPALLTGIVDEKGVQYSSWSYDSEGRAYESFHAGGVDHVSMVFNSNSTTVTNPKGKSTTYTFQELPNGLKVPMTIEGDASANCIASNSAYTYDANGFVASKTDWEGNVTSFIHSDQGLETSRTEAVGTPEEKIVTTEWHSDHRLPIKITEPGRITTFTYSDRGLLLNKTVTPQASPL